MRSSIALSLNLFLKSVPYLDNLNNCLDRKSPSSSRVNKSPNWSILDGVLIGWRQVRAGDIRLIFLVTSSFSPLSGHVCVDVDLLTVFKCRVEQRQSSCVFIVLLITDEIEVPPNNDGTPL